MKICAYSLEVQLWPGWSISFGTMFGFPHLRHASTLAQRVCWFPCHRALTWTMPPKKAPMKKKHVKKKPAKKIVKKPATSLAVPHTQGRSEFECLQCFRGETFGWCDRKELPWSTCWNSRLCEFATVVGGCNEGDLWGARFRMVRLCERQVELLALVSDTARHVWCK